MYTPASLGYDRAITVWSPDGRLFQVEYAMEAVKRGWTAVGVRSPEGVVLAVEKRRVSRLVESIEKIQKIDDHIGLAFAGLSSDARILIDRARVYAQINRLLYDEPIPVEILAKRICDIKQMYTQHGGLRPFGVAFLIAGVDANGPKLVGTEPGGIYISYYAHAIGSGAQQAIELLEKEYDYNIKLEDAIVLSLRALSRGMKEKLSSENVEVALVDTKTKIFRKLTKNQLLKYVELAGGRV